MVNVDQPSGFTLQSPKEGKYVLKCAIKSDYGTALGKGMVVKHTGAADADGRPEVAVTVSASDVDSIGVIIGFDGPPNRDNLSQTYSPASTVGYPIVYTDPFARYTCQEDSVGGALTVTDIGQFIDLVDAGLNTVTGLSGQELDSSLSSGSDGTFRLLALFQTPGNAIGTNAEYLVTFNEHRDISDAVAS